MHNIYILYQKIIHYQKLKKKREENHHQQQQSSNKRATSSLAKIMMNNNSTISWRIKFKTLPVFQKHEERIINPSLSLLWCNSVDQSSIIIISNRAGSCGVRYRFEFHESRVRHQRKKRFERYGKNS